MSTYLVRQHSTLTGHGRVREENLSLTAAKKKIKERAEFLAEDLGVEAQKVDEMRYELHCRNYMVVVSIEEMNPPSSPPQAEDGEAKE